MVQERKSRKELIQPGTYLSLQTAHLIHVNAALGLEDFNDQGEPHGNLRGGHGNDKEYEDLSAEALDHAAKRDHREIRGVQHQFNGHEDNESIAADKHTDDTQGEQDRRKDDVIINGNHY